MKTSEEVRCPVTLISGYRGLAETLILYFSQAGHHLSVLVRNEKALAPLQKQFPKALFVSGDVSVKQHCETWIQKTIETFGAIDCLINNAAIPGPGGKLHEISYDDFERTIKVNLMAPIYLCQLVLSHFLERGRGVVINLSGGGATRPRPHFAAYATSKCALVRFTETLAGEYPQLRFYAVSPGALKTPMVEAVLKLDPKKIGEEYAEAKRRVEQGGEDPKKTAKLALWLMEKQPQSLSGKLISASWDDYQNVPDCPPEVGWWTLRRVDEVCLKNLKSL